MADIRYSKLQALVVDDFDSFRITINKMLQEIGFLQIDTAVNGAEALRHCRTKRYDVILCDYNLGAGKTGQQVLEDLRLHNLQSVDTLFILISAESAKSIIMAAYDYEPDAFLTKPLTNQILEQRLARLFAQRHALAPIYQALKENNKLLAIERLNQAISADSRYTTTCQKILGQLYLSEGNTEQAEVVFRHVLEIRQLDWAQLGMAQVKAAQGDLTAAQQWLEETLATNPLCMKAYDVKIDILYQLNAIQPLQKVLETAVDISPLSILRQKKLGEVATLNGDTKAAATAFRRTVKLGENSCYDQVENHLGFARATLAFMKDSPQEAKPFLRDAMKTLSDIENRFGKQPEAICEAAFVETQLLISQGDTKKAHDALNRAQLLMQSLAENNLTLQLEMVASLKALERTDEAKTLLNELLEANRSEQSSLEKIDQYLDEPVSELNRLKVAAINKKGIGFYELENYLAAIDHFESASLVFPNHIGIRLNLVQAIAGELKRQESQELKEQAMDILSRIDRSIPVDHEQYQRFKQLYVQIRHA